MRYLLLMTLSGSLLFAGYLLWQKLTRNKLTQRMHYSALVMVLLAYMVPLEGMKEIYHALLTVFHRQEEVIVGEVPVSFADISTKEEAFRTQNYWFLLLVAGIWVAASALLLFRKCRRYYREKNEFLLCAGCCRSKLPEKTARRLQKELHCLRVPEIYELPGTDFTFTVGIIKPVIFLRVDYADEDLDSILRHEMVHIVRMDLLVKMLMQFVCCLHWFNPLVDILKSKLERACETSCDERVLEGCTKEERAVYARLIVKNMKKCEREVLIGSALEDDYEIALERVNLIMNATKINRLGKAVATFAFVLILFADSLTAFAYPAVYRVSSETEAANLHAYSDYSLNGGIGEAVSTVPVLYDEQIIDMEGGIHPVSSVSPRGAICLVFGHQKKACYFHAHKKVENGGCETKVFDAETCPICNYVWVYDLVVTYTYPTCPH